MESKINVLQAFEVRHWILDLRFSYFVITQKLLTASTRNFHHIFIFKLSIHDLF